MNDAIVDAAHRHFSATYSDARRKFRDDVAKAGGQAVAYPSSAQGPGGGGLSTDVAWFGSPRASKVGILVSATHGAEGYCGSAAQLDWIAQNGPARLGPDQAILLIHALNPYGFAWDRRVTQEGCDLNRNFVDFSRPLPHNDAYDLLADCFVTREPEGPVVDAAEAKIKAFREEHGELAFRKARSSGQYRHTTGVFFGGFSPTFARQTLERIVAEHSIASRERVIIVDYHTGLGPYGYGELQCEAVSGLSGYERAREIFGLSVTSPDLGTSSAVALNGTQDEYWQGLLGDRHVYVCLEYGTYSPESGRAAMRTDHWLHAYRRLEIETDLGRQVRRRVREHFYPDRLDWKEMVLFRSRQVQRQMVDALA